jgi:cell division protein FtsW
VEQDRRWFVTLAAILLGFGILMVHSASITSRPTDFEQVYLSRHLIFMTVGLALAGAAAILPPRWWRWLAPWLFFLTLVLLVVVLIPGVGTRVKGAQRWLRVGPVSMQPSELAKIALPLFLAQLIERSRSLLRSWLVGPVLFTVPLGLMVPLVLLEPDLGTALFLCFGAAIILWLSGWPLRNFLAAICGAIPAVAYLVIHKPYQLQRIMGFIATWTDLNQAPYQIQQSLATMGAGGLWGVGLGKGWQKLSFLPEANTDFVFAVIGEELGLLGTLSVVALWGGLLFFGVRLLSRMPRGGFERVVGLTLLMQLVFQAGLNVAVVTALVPPKGISHPLISCGGSNLVVSLVSLGIIVSLANASSEAEGLHDSEAQGAPTA